MLIEQELLVNEELMSQDCVIEVDNVEDVIGNLLEEGASENDCEENISVVNHDTEHLLLLRILI